MATTPICNPHICRVLLGTAGYFGVLWDAVGYCGVLWGSWGTVATTWYWRYCGVLGEVWEHLGVIKGSGGYSGVL